MKKWIIAAALLLTSVTAANAGWIKCETITVIPGFSIQRCATPYRYQYRNYYRRYSSGWGLQHGFIPDIFTEKHNRRDRNYHHGNKYPHMNRDLHDKLYRRHYDRW